MYYIPTVSTPNHVSAMLSSTNHAKGPEESIIQAEPALLSQTNRGLPFQSAALRQWLENPVDNNCPDSDESNRGAGDKVDVIPSLHIISSGGLVVRQLEKRGGVGIQRRVEVVNGQ